MWIQQKRARLAMAIFAVITMSACTGSGGVVRSEPPIKSCPPGMVLICESRQPASKGGGEEEIPRYETCRCEEAY